MPTFWYRTILYTYTLPLAKKLFLMQQTTRTLVIRNKKKSVEQVFLFFKIILIFISGNDIEHNQFLSMIINHIGKLKIVSWNENTSKILLKLPLLLKLSKQLTKLIYMMSIYYLHKSLKFHSIFLYS